MGIKFLCPNGHKLHVKGFLSGKKAICPQCGARVVVPADKPATAVAEPEPMMRQAVAGDPKSESDLEASLVDDALELMAGFESGPSLTADAPSPGDVARAATDPLDEAPEAVWYVRAATGGQYGPASAEIMRHWLKEGRIVVNSLVWRAPWTEWRSTQSTFPQLGSASPPLAAAHVGLATPMVPTANGMPPLPAGLPLGHVVQGVAPGPPPVDSAPTMPALAHAARKRRRKNDVTLILSGVLVVASLILAIVLVLVFRSQQTGNQPQIEDPPPADEEPLI
jgi:hypothetical protein